MVARIPSMKSRSLITNATLSDRPGLGEGASVGLALAHDSAARHVRGTAAYIDDLPEPAGTVHVAPGCAGPRARRHPLARPRRGVCLPRGAGGADRRGHPGSERLQPRVRRRSDPRRGRDSLSRPGGLRGGRRHPRRRPARGSPRPCRSRGGASPRHGGRWPGRTERKCSLPTSSATVSRRPRSRTPTHRLEGRVRIGGQEHFYLEGQAALAVPGEDDEMRVWSSTQHPSEVQNLVAHMLGVPGAAVVCECRRMGGAFGGKESQAAQWACLAALAAHATGRPAKVRLDRDDDMTMTGKRHDFRVDWRCGFDGEGVLEGVDVELAGRCGYSADLSLGVNDRAMFHADNAYCYPAARIHSRRVRTDTVSNTAFRGFGGSAGDPVRRAHDGRRSRSPWGSIPWWCASATSTRRGATSLHTECGSMIASSPESSADWNVPAGTRRGAGRSHGSTPGRSARNVRGAAGHCARASRSPRSSSGSRSP